LQTFQQFAGTFLCQPAPHYQIEIEFQLEPGASDYVLCAARNFCAKKRSHHYLTYEQTAWRHEGKGPHCANLQLRTKIKQEHAGWSGAPRSQIVYAFQFSPPIVRNENARKISMNREGKFNHTLATRNRTEEREKTKGNAR
jgi:hypothetical protein